MLYLLHLVPPAWLPACAVFGNDGIEVSKEKVLEIAKELLKTDLLYLLVKVSTSIPSVH